MRDYHMWKEGDTAWVVNQDTGKNELVTVREVRMRYSEEEAENADQLYDGMLVVERPDGIVTHVNTLYAFETEKELELARTMYLVKGPEEDALFEFLPAIPEGYQQYRWYGPEGGMK